MHRYLWQILSDRRLWSGSGIIVVLLMVGVNFWVRRYNARQLEEQKKADVENRRVLLPTETVARFDLSVGDHLDEFWSTIPDARRARLVIVSGNSQINTIDDPQRGDQTLPQWMDDALAPKGTRVWGISAPNLANEELIFQIVSLLNDPATKPHVFIDPVCFDKMRDVDLRPGYERFLRDRPAIQDAYVAVAQRYAQRYPTASAKMLQTIQQLRQTSHQENKSFESQLRLHTEPLVPLVASRKELNIQAQLELYKVRNWLLHIKSTDKRPMIQSRFEMNFQFLQMLNDVCRENGVLPIYYIVPLNPGANNPYVPSEYAAFKERCEKYCREANIPFANFEDIVPAQYWGVHVDGPDFKHFKGPGHKITADALIERFGPYLTGSTTELSGSRR